MRSLRVMGSRIKQLRDEFGWTQDYLAKEITRRYKQQGVKVIQSHIGNLESPLTFKLPSVQLLVALAQVLEVTTDYLCGLTDDQSPPEPRFFNENERAVEDAMKKLSPSNQRRMALMAQSFLEEEKAPSMDALTTAIEAALDAVEALGGEEALVSLMDKLDESPAASAVARRFTVRRNQPVDEP